MPKEYCFESDEIRNYCSCNFVRSVDGKRGEFKTTDERKAKNLRASPFFESKEIREIKSADPNFGLDAKTSYLNERVVQ